MDIRRQLAMMRERFPIIIATVVAVAGLTFVASSLSAKTYDAEARLLVGQALQSANPDYNDLLVSKQLTQTYATLATTKPVIRSVIDRLGLDATPDDVLGRVQAQAPVDSLYITITASDRDPAIAAALANTLADELITESPRVVLGETTGTVTNLLSLVEPAEVPTSPASPRVLFNTAIAAVAGLILGLVLVFLLAYLDERVRTVDDIVELTGLPVLGSIRQKEPADHRVADDLAVLHFPRSPAAETFRSLRTSVSFAVVGTEMRSLLVTSASPGDGKTFVASNLALVFAQSGRRTILVDANLHRPQLGESYGISDEVGLSDVLASPDQPLDRALHQTDEPNLRVMTVGSTRSDAFDLLERGAFAELLAKLSAEASLVVVDGAPLTEVTDPALMASRTDATLLVVRAGRTPRDDLSLASDTLTRVGATVVGVVLNALPQRRWTRPPLRRERHPTIVPTVASRTAPSPTQTSTTPAGQLATMPTGRPATGGPQGSGRGEAAGSIRQIQ